MEKINIDAAAAEAERFLARYKAWRETLIETIYTSAAEGSRTLVRSGPKESGALRRASLDLTRALATMRKA